MRFKDWKAYDSGAMNPDDRADVERLLESSEEARLDYAAYQEYKTILQTAVNAEPIPYERLEGLFPKDAYRKKPVFRPAFFVAAVAAIAFAVFAPRMFGPQSKPPTVAGLTRLETSDPMEAARWMRQGVAFPVPAFKLDGVARLTGAETGPDWGAYKYEVDGRPMRLVIRRNSYQFKECGKKKVGKTTFYVGEYVGWKCPACAYQLSGGNADLRWKLAQAAATEQFGTL